MQLFEFTDSLLSQFNESPNGVLPSRNCYQVFNPIVCFNSVQMVNQIPLGQFTVVGCFPNEMMLQRIKRLPILSTNVSLFITSTGGYNPTSPIPMLASFRQWLATIAMSGSKTVQLFITHDAFGTSSLKFFYLTPITLCLLFCISKNHMLLITHYQKKHHEKYEKHPERREG